MTGSAVIGLSILTAILIVVNGNQLPTASGASSGFAVAMGCLSALFSSASGVALTFVPASVQNGHLDVTSATKVRRLLVVLCGGTALTTILAVLFCTGAVNASLSSAGGPRLPPAHR